MIVIFAALKSEVNELIKKIEPSGESGESVTGKNDIYHGYLRSDSRKQKVMICITGIGAGKALQAANDIIDLGIKNAVFLVLGISGSTDGNTETGDIVIHNKIVNLDFLERSQNNNFQFFDNEYVEKFKIEPEKTAEDFIDLNYHWENDSYKVFMGSGACVPFLIGTHKDKLNIGRNFNVSAVDMESYHIAGVAKANKIPFAVIRAISDDMFTEIPDYFQGFEKMSLMDKFILIVKIVLSPGKLRKTIKLLKGMKKAANNLNDFAIKEIIPFIHKKYFYKS